MLLCQFLVLVGNRQFFVVAGKFYYDQKKKIPVVCLAGCAVVSVFGSGDYDRKVKSSSGLSGGLCCCVSFWFWQEIGSFLLWRESFITTRKKSSSHLSGGLCSCVSFWVWRVRPEEKSSSRLSGELCCCVSFWFWQEIGSY